MSEIKSPILLDATGRQINARLAEIRDALRGHDTGKIYGFHIDSSESDPYECVTYLGDAIGMTPAKMDFENDQFRCGSWENAFFMPRPCMLKYDGTVDYYLDENDYSLKKDGDASDIANDAYEGNAMMEWGRDGRIIWYKIVPEGSDKTSASVYIADYQADENYRAWSFVDAKGNMTEHFYTPIYNGSIDGDGRLRSISGKDYSALCQNKTQPQEVAAAMLNNTTSDVEWLTEVYADVTLINLLLILVGKSLDTQSVFGQGRCGQSSAASSMLGTGTMNNKGLFWGSSATTYGVKVFGMENWWGNQWRRYLGHVTSNYVHRYKMTYGTQDGSSVEGYRTSDNASDYTGYRTGATAPSTSEQFISKMQFDANGMMVKAVEGTSATYYCDLLWIATGLRAARRGGSCGATAAPVGAFCALLSGAPSGAGWSVGASPSCKPLSREG